MKFPQVALGQVETVHPTEYAVSVTFPNLGILSGIRVPVAAAGASRETGQFALPQRGDWGIIQFYQDDPRSARWMGTLTDAFWHAAPLELLKDDPDLKANFERSGRDEYKHGNGDIEVQYPDGSLFRLTHGSDYQKVTERKVGYTEGANRTPKRRKPNRKTASVLHLFFRQGKAGALFHLDPEGNIEMRLDGAYRFEARRDGRVELANERARLTMQGSGASSLTLTNGASVDISASGAVTVKPAPGQPLKLGAGPMYRKPIRELDLGVPPGVPLKATTMTVFISD